MRRQARLDSRIASGCTAPHSEVWKPELGRPICPLLFGRPVSRPRQSCPPGPRRWDDATTHFASSRPSPSRPLYCPCGLLEFCLDPPRLRLPCSVSRPVYARSHPRPIFSPSRPRPSTTTDATRVSPQRPTRAKAQEIVRRRPVVNHTVQFPECSAPLVAARADTANSFMPSTAATHCFLTARGIAAASRVSLTAESPVR